MRSSESISSWGQRRTTKNNAVKNKEKQCREDMHIRCKRDYLGILACASIATEGFEEQQKQLQRRQAPIKSGMGIHSDRCGHSILCILATVVLRALKVSTSAIFRVSVFRVGPRTSLPNQTRTRQPFCSRATEPNDARSFSLGAIRKRYAVLASTGRTTTAAKTTTETIKRYGSIARLVCAMDV